MNVERKMVDNTLYFIIRFSEAQLDEIKNGADYVTAKDVDLDEHRIHIVGTMFGGIVETWQTSGDAYISLADEDIENIKKGCVRQSRFLRINGDCIVAIRLCDDDHQEELIL